MPGSPSRWTSFVLEYLARSGGLDSGLKIRPMTLPDEFQDQDTPYNMYEAAGLNARHIAARAIEALGRGDLAEIERLARA
jgi:1-deoxy-D-xylulose-5-phosphate synthase